jgi:uncharacterized protein (TIRG00374 family)
VKRVLKGVAGVGVSALFIWLFLRDKDLHQMWEELKSADYRYLAAYLGVLLLIHLCRTVRWGILLEPLDKELTFKRLNAVSAVGFMLLIVMPFRLGEFARPALIADKKKISFSNSLASIVVERVVDGLAMTLLLLCTLPFVDSNSPDVNKVRFFGWVFFSIFGGGGLFLAFAYFFHDAALKLGHAVGDRISPTLTAKVLDIAEAFVQGLRSIPSVGKIVAFFGLTVVYWGLNGFGLAVLARGFDLQLTALGAYTTLAVLTVGVMIPAGPGMAGIFQYFTEVGLKLFLPLAIVQRAGAAYSNVVWAAQFGQQVAVGLLFMALGHVDISDAFRFGGDDDSKGGAGKSDDKDDSAKREAVPGVLPQ